MTNFTPRSLRSWPVKFLVLRSAARGSQDPALRRQAADVIAASGSILNAPLTISPQQSCPEAVHRCRGGPRQRPPVKGDATWISRHSLQERRQPSTRSGPVSPTRSNGIRCAAACNSTSSPCPHQQGRQLDHQSAVGRARCAVGGVRYRRRYPGGLRSIRCGLIFATLRLGPRRQIRRRRGGGTIQP